MTINHSLPHKCDKKLRNIIIKEILRQSIETEKQTKLREA